MIYVVDMIDIDDPTNSRVFHLGYSTDIHIAEAYMDIRKTKPNSRRGSITKSNYNFKFKIVPMPFEKFKYLQTKDNGYYACSEIFQVTTNIFLSEDDYEFIESCVNDRVSEMEYHIREIRKTLSLFDDGDAKKARELLKKIKKRIDTDYEGEDFYANLDWEKVIENIIL